MYTTTQQITAWILPILLGITLHEASHAYVAYLCGDDTARKQGRLSINPLRHIDLFGTVIIPIIMAILTHFHFIFGWAKPVRINWHKLRRPRLNMAIVAIAGPLSNILMCLGWACCYKIASNFNPQTSMLTAFFLLSGQAGIFVNLLLAILNLIPIPPLDGSRVIASILPPKLAQYYLRIEPFGFIILILLILTGAFWWLVEPLLLGSLELLEQLFKVSI